MHPLMRYCYNVSMAKSKGKIIIPSGVNVWPHEYKSAEALSAAGYVVEFIPPLDTEGNHTADVLLDGVEWELKSPKSGKIEAIERNLKKGSKQSSRIVFDSRRMKRIPGKAIIRELSIRLKKQKTLTAIIFINRHGVVIDIAPASE